MMLSRGKMLCLAALVCTFCALDVQGFGPPRATPVPNHYAALGLSESAAAEEIRAAYKRKAKQTHPDRVKGREHEFMAAQEAHDTLIDPHKRSEYDMLRADARSGRYRNQDQGRGQGQAYQYRGNDGRVYTAYHSHSSNPWGQQQPYGSEGLLELLLGLLSSPWLLMAGLLAIVVFVNRKDDEPQPQPPHERSRASKQSTSTSQASTTANTVPTKPVVNVWECDPLQALIAPGAPAWKMLSPTSIIDSAASNSRARGGSGTHTSVVCVALLPNDLFEGHGPSGWRLSSLGSSVVAALHAVAQCVNGSQLPQDHRPRYAWAVAPTATKARKQHSHVGSASDGPCKPATLCRDRGIETYHSDWARRLRKCMPVPHDASGDCEGGECEASLRDARRGWFEDDSPPHPVLLLSLIYINSELSTASLCSHTFPLPQAACEEGDHGSAASHCHGGGAEAMPQTGGSEVCTGTSSALADDVNGWLLSALQNQLRRRDVTDLLQPLLVPSTTT